MRNLCIAFICLSLALPALAEVYKRTLPDGSVEFTDKPPEKNATPLNLPPLTTFPATQAPKLQSGGQATDSGPATAYQSLAISSPADDATVRENSGNLTVTVAVSPSLARGHLFALLLDGKKVAENTGASIQLTDIERGSHSLEVHIVDNTGDTLFSSKPVTFHMKRASAQFRNP